MAEINIIANVTCPYENSQTNLFFTSESWLISSRESSHKNLSQLRVTLFEAD